MAMIGVMMFLGGLLSFSVGIYYVLKMLISLEYMMIGVFFILLLTGSGMFYETILMFMILGVCEASLGLSLLVCGVMKGGNKYFSLADILMW